MVMMNSVSGDSESGESNSSGQGEEKNIIDKILGEMKSEFNKTEKKSVTSEDCNTEDIMTENVSGDTPIDSSLLSVTQDVAENVIEKTEDSTNENHTEDDTQNSPETVTPNNLEETSDKPRIILSFKKPNNESPTKNKQDNNTISRRSLRHKTNYLEEKIDESMLKRSARRRSKDYNESVLQSAIARKEKSYNESNKPQRLTRQLKPTQKILENLALAKQEKTKTEKVKTLKINDKQKNNDSDSYTETDGKIEENHDRIHRKHKHKHHHNKHSKRVKRFKSNHGDSSKDSDSDQSTGQEENNSKNSPKKTEETKFRRSRRISASRFKDDSNTDMDDQSLQESSTNDETSVYSNNVECSSVGAELIASRLCLCTQKTQYYLAANSEDVIYCKAIDSIDEKVLGCSRTINTKEVMMMRSSTRVPYTILCQSHKNRLLRHNCCPTCGIFCTQGRFVECPAKHHYHRDCQISVGNVQCCPHCGLSTPDYDVNITMHSSKKPIFLPVQRAQYVSARMSFQNNCKNEDEIKCVTPPLLPIDALDIQASIKYGDEYEIDDLIAAIKNNDTEKIAAILGSKSVDISCKIPEFNDGTVLHFAAQKNFVAIVHMLLVSGLQSDVFDKEQNTPLMLAVLSSCNDVVQYLIRTGACVDIKGTDGMTALHLAAKCGNLKACELLLNGTNAMKNFVNAQDDGGWTPLVWACEHGYADIAKFLIHKGADTSVRDVEHNVALHWAAFSGSSHIAELLLNMGCDVNAVNAHGDTPLHIGARQDMYNCIIVLLAKGADVTLLNKNNESPLDCVPPGGDCYNPISLNITLQATVEFGCPNVILSNDISKGKEANPIQCYNNIDSDPKPTNFRYITKNCISSDDVKIDIKINSLQSCMCEERCVEDDCLCGKLSVRCWYDEEGKLLSDFNFNDIPMIFECNDRCACNAITCNNRVVQKGLTQRFELFKTMDKGWGIRTLRLIPKGSFVCEYIGEIITDLEAERREDDSFLFDLENRVCKNINDSDSYCIDARFYGNFARFINHSCNPNLTSVKVFIEHQDLRFPRIAFFANKDIMCDEELSFDYGEKFWLAKYKSFSCLCGSLECKYSEDTIESTMQNHQRRLEECG